MDIIKKIVEWFEANVTKSKPVVYAFYFYCGVVAVGTTYGAYKGFLSWLRWRQTRKLTSIKYKTIEPIVNNSIDSGQLGLHVLMSGLISGLVVATAPISVPIIVFTMKEDEESK